MDNLSTREQLRDIFLLVKSEYEMAEDLKKANAMNTNGRIQRTCEFHQKHKT